VALDATLLFELGRLDEAHRFDRGEGEGAARRGDAGRSEQPVAHALTRLRQLACHPGLVEAGQGVASSKLATLRSLVHKLREQGH